MLRRLLNLLWRHMPRRLTRWGVRVTQPRFAISAGAVALDERGRVLLLRHVFRRGSGWGIPGVFLRHNEQPEEALRRELREEVGIEITDLRLAFARTITHARQLEIIYCCRACGEVKPQSVEINGAAWFDPKDLPQTLAPAQARIIERALGAWQSGERRDKI
jgi:ADP-ribose pyrophosphatase YjhB (NUDIX family)